VDKCDENVTSQTTISINVAFDRIWTLAVSMERGTKRKDFACILRSHCHTESRSMVCPFRCTNLQQIPTFASGMHEICPVLSAHCIDATASSWHVNFLARCNTRYKQSVVHDVIIPFAQRYFYWNWCKAMFLFQLISITFYTYLANTVFFVRLGL